MASADAQTGIVVEMAIPNPKLWSPDSPFLYNVDVTLDGDVVHSYFGMRTISLGKVPLEAELQGDRTGMFRCILPLLNCSNPSIGN